MPLNTTVIKNFLFPVSSQELAFQQQSRFGRMAFTNLASSESEGNTIRSRWGWVVGILFVVALFTSLYGAFIFWNWPWAFNPTFIIPQDANTSLFMGFKDIAFACSLVMTIPVLGGILAFCCGWVYQPVALYWLLLILSFTESLAVLAVGAFIIHQGRIRVNAWNALTSSQWSTFGFATQDFFQHAFGQTCCGFNANDDLAYTGTTFNGNALAGSSSCPSSSSSYPGCHELGAKFFYRELVLFGALYIVFGFLLTFGSTVLVHSTRHMNLMSVYVEEYYDSKFDVEVPVTSKLTSDGIVMNQQQKVKINA